MEEVLIVGSGPIGMSCALFLNQYGHSCTIIDQDAGVTDLSKAILINPASLEKFEESGLAQKLIQEGLKIRAGNIYNEQKLITRLPFDHLPTKYRFGLGLPQHKTEALLEEELYTRDIYIERESRFLTYDEEESCISAKIMHKGREGSIQARYLVGADGIHSRVRESSGISFPGESFNLVFHGYDVRVNTMLPPNEIHTIYIGKYVSLFIPFEEGVFRLITTAPTLEKAAVPQFEIEEVLWKTEFHISTHLAKTFQRGRIFLMGDAAHVHSPVGGRGMNNGFEDALTFAQCLSEKTFSKYAYSRRKKAQEIAQETKSMTYLLYYQNFLVVFLRKHILPLVLKIPTLLSKLIAHNIGLR